MLKMRLLAFFASSVVSFRYCSLTACLESLAVCGKPNSSFSVACSLQLGNERLVAERPSMLRVRVELLLADEKSYLAHWSVPDSFMWLDVHAGDSKVEELSYQAI